MILYPQYSLCMCATTKRESRLSVLSTADFTPAVKLKPLKPQTHSQINMIPLFCTGFLFSLPISRHLVLCSPHLFSRLHQPLLSFLFYSLHPSIFYVALLCSIIHNNSRNSIGKSTVYSRKTKIPIWKSIYFFLTSVQLCLIHRHWRLQCRLWTQVPIWKTRQQMLSEICVCVCV